MSKDKRIAQSRSFQHFTKTKKLSRINSNWSIYCSDISNIVKFGEWNFLNDLIAEGVPQSQDTRDEIMKNNSKSFAF